MKVSVIIPTYNRAGLIVESIQSVLNQTFTDFEIIILDDGSTDNTKQVVEKFQDHRIKYVYQENGGVVMAANHGFEVSSGEYVLFLGSDDLLVKNALEKEVQVLDRHPEVAFSYGQVYVIDDKSRIIGLNKLNQKQSGIYQGTQEIREFLINGNHIPIQTAMIRRSCLSEVGLYDLAFSSGSEDHDLMLRLTKKYAVAYIAEPLAKYRSHAGRITVTRKMDEEERSKSRILESILNDPEVGHLFSSERPRAYFSLHLRLACRAYDFGQRDIARKHLFRAMRVYPGGFYKGLFLTWIYWFLKTWIPLPVIRSIRGFRSYFYKGESSNNSTL